MAKGDFLGEFEQLVLLAILRLGEDAYGMTIRREIEDRAKRDVSIGAVYATLDRLEGKGYVKSRLGDPASERGGRAKRFFELDASGLKAVRESVGALRRMTEDLNWKAL
jgi:DNA-binding PadR family transcriptional regulator